jgi:hypothetical protein
VLPGGRGDGPPSVDGNTRSRTLTPIAQLNDSTDVVDGTVPRFADSYGCTASTRACAGERSRPPRARARPRSMSQYASHLLAYCDMRTLYLRNVPEDVVERLERLAARDATSVAAVAVRELAEVSRRADNPALLGALPDLDVDTATILADVDGGRAER